MPSKIQLGPNEDVINLASGHSMIMGNLPQGKLDLGIVADKINKDAEQGLIDNERFGLFDSSQPNYTTYYPDVTAEDLNPTDDEFIYPVFRMLSMTTVHRNVNPISFEKKGVLKASMDKLVGQTVNVDHETAVGNAIGVVQSVEWQNAYRTENGTIIPAGINAVLKIDAKANPRLARGVMMSPPSIHSNSVTIRFKWEQSHPKMEADEFWAKLGTYDEDGVMVQRVVNEVIDYSETSLVAHGADPFAKKIEGGKIVLPEHSANRASLSEAQLDKQANRTIAISYKEMGEDIVSNSQQTIPNSNNNNNHNLKPETQMKELLAKLAAIAKIEDASELTEDSFAEKLQEIVSNGETAANEVTELKQKVEGLETELTEAKATIEAAPTEDQLSELKEKAELGDAHLTAVKEAAKSAYSTLKGEKASDAVLNSIDSADLEAAKAFKAEYEEELENSHPLTCQDCHSVNLSRSSSSLTEKPEDKKKPEGEGNTKLSTEEIRNKYKMPKGGLLGIFKQEEK